MNVNSKFSSIVLNDYSQLTFGQKIAAILMPCKRHVTSLFLRVDGKVVDGEGKN